MDRFGLQGFLGFKLGSKVSLEDFNLSTLMQSALMAEGSSISLMAKIGLISFLVVMVVGAALCIGFAQVIGKGV